MVNMTRPENAVEVRSEIEDLLTVAHGDERVEMSVAMLEFWRDALPEAGSESQEYTEPYEDPETPEDLFEKIRDDLNGEVLSHTTVPEGPPNADSSLMAGREVVTFRLGTAKMVGYRLSATLRSWGFIHDYTATDLQGSKFNPVRVVRQQWSRPAPPDGGE